MTQAAEATAPEIDEAVADELRALVSGYEADVPEDHVFEVLAQRCPPQPLGA